MSASSELSAMLTALVGSPHDSKRIEQQIQARFGAESAVMVVDMVGFSEFLADGGPIDALLTIHRFRLLCEPIIEARGGVVIKTEADNLFAVFEAVAAALHASIAIMGQLDSAEGAELYASIGIGYGSILNIGNERIAGREVNLAFKLGEDVADRGEVLLTPAAAAQVGNSSRKLERRQGLVGGVLIEHHRLCDAAGNRA